MKTNTFLVRFRTVSLTALEAIVVADTAEQARKAVTEHCKKVRQDPLLDVYSVAIVTGGLYEISANY